MKVLLTERAINSIAAAPAPVQRAFLKQIHFLSRNIQHPSLHAKKYSEADGEWQARVNDDWRFYFTVQGSAFTISDVIPHPK